MMNLGKRITKKEKNRGANLKTSQGKPNKRRRREIK